MTITKLKTNRLVNPLGHALGDTPRLSWIVTSEQGTHQTEARVEVSTVLDFESLAFDSGFKADIDSICYPLDGLSILPRTRYYWRVTVTTNAGETATSESSWFETSKLDEPWQGDWIAPDFDKEWHPLLGTSFVVDKPVKRARGYFCGLGLYEAYLNGEKIGNEFLAPGLVAYDKWIPYQTYDMTSLFVAGENKLEVMLGNGWYKGRYGLVRQKTVQYGDEFAFIGEVALEYEDGTIDTFVTNEEDWSATRSAVTGTILSCNIFDGEVRDDTFGDDTVYKVKQANIDKELLQPRRSPATREMHRIKPIAVLKTPAGETVLDMGQNMVGWLEFKNKAPKGAEIYLQFGEVLQQDNFYRENMRTALCEYRYISDGTEKIVRPYFTFYGFRYVKLTGWHQPVDLEDFVGCVLYSDMEETGSITTSDEKINKLFQNTMWGQRGNFLDTPTDCPQRDERMGWTGDAQVFFGTSAFNMDVYAFFDKFCYDLMQEQNALGGDIPVVIPKHDVVQTGACGWADAATIIPWNMYVRYGDKAFLEQQYPSMKAWVDFVKKQDDATGGTGLWKGSFHYGDWLSLDVDTPGDYRFGGTERIYLASCFYRYSAGLVAKAAEVLGRTEDAKYYSTLSEHTREAIQKEYVTSSGRLSVTTQTAYTLALFMDIVKEEHRPQTAKALRMKLKESEYHLRTGFLGTPYLCRVLSQNGSNDIAYRLILQEGYPSWLYQINMGATTIWERWNSILPDGSISDTGMNSLNHYSYGSIVEWLYRNGGGINPLEEYPGFRKFTIAPQPNYRLSELESRFESPVGTIRSGWKILASGELVITLSVPFGAQALVTLPYAEKTEHSAPFTLSAGSYQYRYLPSIPVAEDYTIDTPISTLYQVPAVAELLKKELPDLTGMMLFSMMAGERSLRDFMEEKILQLSPDEIKRLTEKMRQAAGR